jgi:hypothetical protein
MITYIRHTGDGTTSQFNLPFTYLSPDFVKVKVNGEVVSFSFVSPTRVQLTSTPALGDTVDIFRQTQETPLVTFSNPAQLNADVLNVVTQQSIDLAQERNFTSQQLEGALNAAATAVAAAASITEGRLNNVFFTSEYPSLALALIAASGGTLYINSEVVIAANTTISIPIVVTVPGSFVISAGALLTINSDFSAGNSQCFAGDGGVLFAKGSVREVLAKWFGTDGDAIQKAVDACALYIKKVHIASGEWLVSTGIQLPLSNTMQGIEISGAKSEATYEWEPPSIPETYATVLKASAAMSCVIRARGDLVATTPEGDYQLTKMTHATKIRNLAINGNGNADYAYINGQFDLIEDVTVVNCKRSGIYCGMWTNSSVFNRVSSIANAENGAVLDGDWSTVSSWNNCKFRGNGGSGMLVYSTVGLHSSDCVFENNNGTGVSFYRPDTSPSHQIFNVLFSKPHIEQNNAIGGYQIAITGATDSNPMNIRFDAATINSGTDGKLGVSIQRGTQVSFNDPVFTGDNALGFGHGTSRTGWFNVADTALVSGVRVTGFPEWMIPYVLIDGAGASHVSLFGDKLTGARGSYLTGVLKTSVIKNQVNAFPTRVLTGAEVSDTVLNSFGLDAATVLTLPEPDEVYSFTVFVTGNPSKWLTFHSATGSQIYLNGTLYTDINHSTATGAAIRFTAVHTSVNCWLAEVIHGTWTGA